MDQSVGEEPRPDVTPSRWRLLLAGARRGAKFGAKVMLIIALVVGLFSTVASLALSIHQGRFAIGWETVLGIGGFCVGTALMMVYGAIAGAVIMGLAGMLSAPQSDANVSTPHPLDDDNAR